MSHQTPHVYETPEEGKAPVVIIVLAAIMIIVFLLYNRKVLVTLPCGNDFKSIILSQFVHVNIVHLASNLFSLWYMANLEHSLGFSKFIGLVVIITLISSAVDTLIGHHAGKRQCSIGFSGVLFGLVAWSVLTTGGFRWYNLAMVAGLLLTNMGPHISVRGHVIGALTGVLLALIYKIMPRSKVY
jgi:membrane associated rhomboid family serine protease